MVTALTPEQLQQAVTVLRRGGVIAYPTEAVYGLGCDPFIEQAIKKILAVKQRSIAKGLIVVAADFVQLKNLIDADIPPNILERARKTWPGPYTWLFPPKKNISSLLVGEYSTIAVRVSAHPVVQQLCLALDGPLVSTSANVAGEQPLMDYHQVSEKFLGMLDYVCPGDVGGLERPTVIRDLMTGKEIRS